jgi:hypothetical protein
MFIDRITLVRIYRVLKFIQINEGIGATNAHVHAIALQQKSNQRQEKKPALANLESLAHTIQTQYPYIQYNYKQILPTYRESIWSLVSFGLKRAGETRDIQMQTQTNFHVLNRLSANKLRTLQTQNLGLKLQNEFEYERYVRKNYMPKDYVAGTLSARAQALLDTYYKETRSLEK